MTESKIAARAARLQKDVLVWNACETTSLTYADDIWVAKLRRSGVAACIHTVGLDQSAKQAMAEMARWRRLYEANGMMLGRAPGDAAAARAEGKIAMYMGWQDILPLEGDLDLLDAFYDLGLRVLQPTYQYRTLAADGCGERVQSGLSRFGIKLVERCNQLGIMLDVSHVGDASSMEIAECSRSPIMATHVGARALVDTVRNKPDDLIRAIAARGGAIGIAGKSGFLRRNGLETGSTLDDYVDHVKHVCDMVGVDHVAIGTDVSDDRRYNHAFLEDFHRRFPEVAIIGDSLNIAMMHPVGLQNPSELANITDALVRRGFNDGDVAKIIGDNVQRVLNAALRPQ
jgi:microsomal dipeptidase-like Zn-dependent dipeptidase